MEKVSGLHIATMHKISICRTGFKNLHFLYWNWDVNDDDDDDNKRRKNNGYHFI